MVDNLDQTTNNMDQIRQIIFGEQMEKQFIESALKMTNGNKSKAAQLLGLSRDTLRYRIEKFDIQ